MAGRDLFCPTLPPGYKKDGSEEKIASPAGPALPPGFTRHNKSDHSSDSETDSSSGSESGSGSEASDSASGSHPHKRLNIGPALPPGFQRQDVNHSITPSLSIGPQIPADLLKSSSSSVAMAAASAAAAVSSDDDEEDVVGPVPSSHVVGDISSSAAEIDYRAKKMRDKLLNLDAPEVTQREAWMMELPAASNKTCAMALMARTFRTDPSASRDLGDRSVWTDTPEDKQRKQEDLESGRGVKRPLDDGHAVPSARDLMMAQQVQSYNEANRTLSLLDMHTQKLQKKEKKKEKKKKKEKDKKKKKKKEKEKEKEKRKKSKKETKVERRPFDRDVDLQANRFDAAQKNLMIKRSQELNTRFGSSSTAKFL